MPITSRDPELKRQRGYADPKSYVLVDGSEVLYGKDWENRKVELWERCAGRCEALTAISWKLGKLMGCFNDAADPHHIKPRSKGRDDRLSNLQALCRYHHRLLDERKIGGRHANRATSNLG